MSDINNDTYYAIAEKGSSDNSSESMVTLKKLAAKANTILDVGCGEGTRLNYLAKNNKGAVGIDVSKYAIQLANKKFPGNKHLVADCEKIPFPDGRFDLVYSAFVFEHLDNPEKVFTEMGRVLKTGGSMVIAAPNYGAPNRVSPPSKQNRLSKLIGGLIDDFIRSKNNLNWQKVKSIATSTKYEIDFDTTVEPYLFSLERYIKQKGYKVINSSSLWNEEDPNAGVFQKIIKWLGTKNIFPFNYWGPHLLLVIQKKQ
jgi:ubiquinone/menaquinone biosynthesis C-methylase UbiE